MRSVKSIRAAKIGYIVVAAALCALGALLILKPDLSLSIIGTIAGIVLMAFGAVKLTGYFSRDLYRLAFQHDLALGILLIALSVVILIRPEHMMSFLCVVLGIAILADGLFKVQTALDARRFGLRSSWLILSLAIISRSTPPPGNRWRRRFWRPSRPRCAPRWRPRRARRWRPPCATPTRRP